MKKLAKTLTLSIALISGVAALTAANTASAAPGHCWVNRHGVKHCRYVPPRVRHHRRYCRRHGCYRPYYPGPVVIGPVIRPPVVVVRPPIVRFGW